MDRLQRICVSWQFVVTPPQDPGKANGHARLVPCRFLDRFKAQLEDKLRLHGTYRAEFLDRIISNKAIDFPDL